MIASMGRTPALMARCYSLWNAPNVILFTHINICSASRLFTFEHNSTRDLMTRLIAAAIAVLCLLFTTSTASHAKPRFEAGGVVSCDDRYPATCDKRGWTREKRATKHRSSFRVPVRRVSARAAHVRKAQAHRHARVARAAPALPRGASENGHPHHQAARLQGVVSEILPHPRGCPPRLFCGCGAAVKVFGSPIRSLWLARNWFRFPPATPAPGMVAVRRGHVFVIEQVIGPRTVLAYDANSGRRLTRRHVRSLAGYSVRDPRG
jgi:hypothetical protein